MSIRRRGELEFRFDEDTWNAVVDAAMEDAWTRQKMRKEIKRLKEKGIITCP